MKFNTHYKYEGRHALFSPSQSSWLRYDEEKAKEVFHNRMAAARGTQLHEVAKSLIDLGIKQKKSKTTFCSYVNDAIGFKMSTEVVLFYSERFYGTADAISFRDNVLRIHDLKTGKIPASIEQLEIYAALFCLEYGIKPGSIEMELRIYQNDEVLCHNATAEDILPIMDHIVSLDKLLQRLEEEV